MGNTTHKYFSEREAREILGQDIWNRLDSQLDSLGGAVDYVQFGRMVLQRFHGIPKYLCECLFRAFISDPRSLIEVNDFICTLAIVKSLNTPILLSFVFRVYDSRGAGEISRKQMLKMLSVAYGSDLSQYNVEFELDKLFENTSTENLITAREFEVYRGPSRVFTEWITAVLSSFLEPPPARLEALEIKYSTTREADQMMMQYNIPKALCNKLHRMFTTLCQSYGRPEMDLKTWLKQATKYVHPALAFEIFRAKLHDVKVAWRFVDFFEYCYLFGLFLPNTTEAETHSTTTFSTIERQAAALCTIFQLAAERDMDDTEQNMLSVPAEEPGSFASSSYSRRDSRKTKLVLYMRRLIYLLSVASPNKIPNATEDTIGKLARRVSIDPSEKSSYAYAAATACAPVTNPQFDVFKLSPLDTMSSAELDKLSNLSVAAAADGRLSDIAPVVVKALLDLEGSCKSEPSLKEYVGLLCGLSNFLPGFQQLSMLACCTFGVKPLVPDLEKLYIIDLTLSKQEESPQTRECPNGPIGTEWALLSSAWLNSWRFFVGHKRRAGSVHLSDSAIKEQLAKEDSSVAARGSANRRLWVSNGGGGAHPIIKNVVNAVMPMSILSSIMKPFGDGDNSGDTEDIQNNSTDRAGNPTEVSAIDNFSIVRKKPALSFVRKYDKECGNENNSTGGNSAQPAGVTATVPVLVPGVDISQHLELVPPDVYKALFLWYGGGPQITRTVILNEHGRPELELYPLRLRVCRCDPNGNPSADEIEFLFSKMASIGYVIEGICSYFRCSPGSAKLWDYATSDWKTQKLLSDTAVSLAAASIIDGQLVLLEVSLGDGTWPRSQRQSELEAELAASEYKRSGSGPLHTSNSLTSLVSASKTAGGGLLARSRFPKANNYEVQSPVGRTVLNKGRVGIDNLGNTCYMNSSLQVLLHTDQLVEYFMRKAYLKHVNIHSRHGYKGRLAHAFGKLVTNMWCTDKSSVSPRNFRAELSQIREEFAGNDQHDAQELLVFLLDGLSEDVNLVHEKPYIEHPDSDDRSDEELANIWWENHKKRENSVIQALFTGQFKSVMKCANCNYTSARFEPFNSLALPLLEDHTKTVCLDVVTLGCKFRIQRCIVVVNRNDTLQAAVDRIITEEYGILGLGSATPYFLAAEVSQSIVREFHPLTRNINDLLNNQVIALYEVMRPFHFASDEESANTTEAAAGSSNRPGSFSSAKLVIAQPVEEAMDIDEESGVSVDVPERLQKTDVSSHTAMVMSPKEHSVEEVVRLVVLQRRARYTVGGGISSFSLEPIGIPIIDVIDRRVAASDIYAMISSKLKNCLKAPLDVLLSGSKANTINRHGVKGGLGTSSEALFSFSKSSGAYASSSRSSTAVEVSEERSSVQSMSDLNVYYNLGSDGHESGVLSSRSSLESPIMPSIRPVEIEEAVAKDISEHGFVLRYVRPDGTTCPNCPWIHGCQGCLLPDSPDLMVDIKDGTVFAADWHYVVYHELIESAGTNRSDIIHPSMEQAQKDRNVRKIALNSCLDKFMEEEKLDGIVCPKCREDSHMSKNFILWRLPPVLFIQLKRFQFDRFSRRKLNDLVDFPIENLDLTQYLAPGSPHLSSFAGNGPKIESDEAGNCCCRANDIAEGGHVCSKYSLYAVVHHVGIMGGGHYVASVRDNSASMEALRENVSAVADASDQGLALNEDSENAGQCPSESSPGRGTPLSRQWWCYNDSTVTPIKEEDIVSPSAYLLFYMRNDIARGTHKLEDIFRYAEPVDAEELVNQIDVVAKGDAETANDDYRNSGGAKYELGDDVSTRRGRAAGSSVSDDAKGCTSGANGSGVENETGAKKEKSTRGPGRSSKKVGYTEEEFEKIMENNVENPQQCVLS